MSVFKGVLQHNWELSGRMHGCDNFDYRHFRPPANGSGNTEKNGVAPRFAIGGPPPHNYSALTISSTIFLASANSIMVLSA